MTVTLNPNDPVRVLCLERWACAGEKGVRDAGVNVRSSLRSFSMRSREILSPPSSFGFGTILCVLIVLALCAGPSYAQQADNAAASVPSELVSRVSAAFQNGDAQQLLGETSNRIEVGLPGTRAYYSRSQAVYVLREFFEEHDPTRFTVEDVSEAGASYFVTGRFWYSRSEQPMHVYTRFANGDGYTVYEIRVEPIRE